jgi:hypothetical protein
MGVFAKEKRPSLRQAPLQQIWRDHLLAGSLKYAGGPDGSRFDEGFFAFVYPKDNVPCATAINAYRSCLSSTESIVAWTLEDIVDCLKKHTQGAWPDAVTKRYLAFSALDRLLQPNR